MENQNKTALAKDRTSLATKRTKLANTRTLLSYIRTCLLFVGVAIAFYALEKTFNWICITLSVIAGIILLIGIIHFLGVDQYVKGVNNEEWHTYYNCFLK